MLTYKFIIFFGEQDIILVQGKNSKFRQDNALGNLYVVAKICRAMLIQQQTPHFQVIFEKIGQEVKVNLAPESTLGAVPYGGDP